MDDFEYQEYLTHFNNDILTLVVVKEDDWYIPFLFGDTSGREWELTDGCDNLKQAIEDGKNALNNFINALNEM
jgi:hypothetical protein